MILKYRPEFALAVVAFVWGSTFVLVKSALADVSTLLFLALRFSLAGAALAIACRGLLSGTFSRTGAHWHGGALAGVCTFGGYFFQTWGLRWTSPSKSAFLTGLAIVLVPVLHSLIHRVAPRTSEAAGVVVATAGMGLMTLENTAVGVNTGDLLTLVGAVFFALQIIVLGRFSARDGFERISVLQIGVASALALASFWWAEPVRVSWSLTLLAALAVTGLFATAAAFTLQAWAQQHTSPTRTALIFALEPVFAAVTSFFALGEVLSARVLTGAVMILAGILLVELKPLGAKEHLN